jgi:cation diffusion facilitator CzcD-associated flavoprotein CzcO
VPLETHYYEAFNRDNVHLVDLSETPIERVTENGLLTSEREYELDVLVYATGFDAVTGAFDGIDIHGRSGFELRECWREGPETFLGMLVHGFPNFFMPTGPQSGSASTNYPRGIETGVNWCTVLLQHMRKSGAALVEPSAEAQRRWTDHLKKLYEIMLMRKAQGWFTGYNSNVEGHEAGKIRYFVYNGGAPKYRARLREVAERGYDGLVFSSGAEAATVPPAGIVPGLS